jgi:RNA polymerase sigma-70 factor (ECF subfamily)
MASKTSDGIPDEPKEASDPLITVIVGCRRLDPVAQRELVELTQDRVFRTVYRLVGPSDAEDVTQQVYMQVFRQLDRFSAQSAFSTWLYRVTVNEALQHLRSRRGPRSDSLNWEPEDREPDRERRFEDREILDHALSRIDAELRIVFVLREVDGLSYEQIATTLELPMGTVASRLSRAREELQDQLRQLGWTA